MDLTDALFSPAWLWSGHVVFALVTLGIIRHAPWRRLTDNATQQVWFGACVVLMGLWSIKAGIKPGLDFHLLGATALSLMFGPELAIAAVAVVLLMVTAFGIGGWQSFSLNMLCMGVVPVAVSRAIYRVVDGKLPNHFFVYIFLNAFIGGGIAIVSSGLAATALLWASGGYSGDYLAHQYLPYYLLMAWSEALTTGMAMTLMVVYRPQWVATFDDARYIHHK